MATTRAADALEGQRALFDQATYVLLVERIRSVKTRLRPIFMLKGPTITRDFAISEIPDPCGFNGRSYAASALPGTRLLVFLLPGKPSDRTLITVLEPKTITEPRMRAMIDRTN